MYCLDDSKNAAAMRDAHYKTRWCKFHDDECRDLARGFCRFAHQEEELRCYGFAVRGECDHARVPGSSCPRQHTAPPSFLLAYSRKALTPVTFDSQGTKPRDARGPKYARFQAFMPLLPELTAVIAKSKVEAQRPLQVPQGLVEKLQRLAAAVTTSEEVRKELLTLQLHIEEATNQHDIRRYDLLHVSVRDTGDLYRCKFRIDCEGLAEKRPSVIRGDEIKVMDVASGKWHQGFVWWSNLDHVVADFEEGVLTPGHAYHVLFSVPRGPVLAQHGGVQTTLLWLTRPLTTSNHALRIADFITDAQFTAASVARKHQLNNEQTRFIEQVIAPSGVPQLQILHGPPGTGKTTTVVAAVDAVVGRFPQARVLVVTPSNMSADLIVERLATKLPRSCSMMRVNALGRDGKLIPPQVQPYCPSTFPTSEELKQLRVVVATLVTSSKIMAVIPRSSSHESYDFIFVDEAGQATEAEACIATAFANKHTRFILAGDHKQLGPVIRNSHCRATGMSKSALERLGDEQAAMMMLVQNYRSHPAIIELFNPTYAGRLLPQRPWSTDGMARTLNLPNRQYPVCFIHSESVEEREADSPSWMNLGEITVVIDKLEALLRAGVPCSDIVVLAPYAKQCQKTKQVLHHLFFGPAASWGAFVPSGATKKSSCPIEVCSVEQFQGREAKIIIMSCVRSQEAGQVTQDTRMSIGFLGQRQRLNVALSRARDLLLIVGNARLLWQADVEWARVIKIILDHKAIVRAKSQTTVVDENDLGEAATVAGTRLVPSVQLDGDAAAADPEWRREGQ